MMPEARDRPFTCPWCGQTGTGSIRYGRLPFVRIRCDRCGKIEAELPIRAGLDWTRGG